MSWLPQLPKSDPVREAQGAVPYPIVDYDSDSESDNESSTSDDTLKNTPVQRPLRAFLPAGRAPDGSNLYSIGVFEAVGNPGSCNSSSSTLVSDATYYKLMTPNPPPKSPLRDQNLPVPPKKGSRWYRYLRWNFFSVYRRIFTLVFMGNLVPFCIVIARAILSDSGLSYGNCATAVSANLLTAMVVRNEHVVNAMFKVFAISPTRTPLFLRRLFAKVYSYGGIHSGCGVAAFLWYLIFLVALVNKFENPNALRGYILLDSFVICVLLGAIIIFAHPRLRVLIHNWFEGTHRFLGWSIIILFWALVLMLAADSAQTSGIPMSMAVVLTPSFWMLIVITLLVIYPWTRLRLRDVEAEAMSDHVVKLNFDYANVHYGQAIRLSDWPLKETHAFAVIPNPTAPIRNTLPSITAEEGKGKELVGEDTAEPEKPRGLSNVGKPGFSVLVSNAGDWTSKIIRSPPKRLWTRGVPQYGVLRVAGLFEPCIVIATGSGIGPCLSLFVQKPDHPVRIIWSAQSPVETYGQAVIDTIRNADPRAVIIDTRKSGRPDLVSIAYRIWETSRWEGPRGFALGNPLGIVEPKTKATGQCEAVVIISNQKVTRKVVYGLESRGVPAYGAIFDS